jgi:hypothetical protein
MTETQRHAVAAGFLHVLQTKPDVYAQWMKIAKDDYAGIGKLIQDTMGLAQTPSKDDLNAMAAYVDAHLQDQVSAIQEADTNAPRHVGFMVLTTQN